MGIGMGIGMGMGVGIPEGIVAASKSDAHRAVSSSKGKDRSQVLSPSSKGRSARRI